MTAKAERKKSKLRRNKIANKSMDDETARSTITWILEQRAQFAPEAEIVAKLELSGLSPIHAANLYQHVKLTYETLDPGYQQELIVQLRTAARLTAKQIANLMDACKTPSEKAGVIALSMRNQEQVRKLLPAQLQIKSTGADVEKVMFDLFNLAADEET